MTLSDQSLLEATWEHSRDGLLLLKWVEERQDLQVVLINPVAHQMTTGRLIPGTFLCEELPVHRELNPFIGARLIDYYKGILDSGLASKRTFPVDDETVGGWWENDSVAIGDRHLFMTFRNISKFMIDELTGLADRKQFNYRIEEWSKKGEAFLLASVDLNKFKLANDQYGHQTGDEILKIVGQRLKEWRRPQDQAFRISGDEFLVLIAEGISTFESAWSINEAVSQPMILEGRGDYIPSCAIGIVSFEPGLTPDELLAGVDEQMYLSKAKGSPSILHNWDDAIYRLADGLRKEMKLGGELSLYYQPIVRLSDESIVSFEALIRWPLPDRQISADMIISAIKRHDLIEDFALWTINQAESQWRKWGKPPQTIAVNCSPSWLKRDVIYHAFFDSQGVAIEITEDELLDNASVLQRVNALRGKGLSVYIDDFGKEYSSLGAIDRLSADRIKLDRSISEKPLLASGAFFLMKQLGIPTVAEGIESRSMLENLREIGIQYGQGYLWGMPRPGNEIFKERICP